MAPMHFSRLFRWFLGWASTIRVGADRLRHEWRPDADDGHVPQRDGRNPAHRKVAPLSSDEHFLAQGTLTTAWA